MLVGFLVGTIETPIPIYRIEKFGYIHDLWVDDLIAMRASPGR